jgi:hypothetical protein
MTVPALYLDFLAGVYYCASDGYVTFADLIGGTDVVVDGGGLLVDNLALGSNPEGTALFNSNWNGAAGANFAIVIDFVSDGTANNSDVIQVVASGGGPLLQIVSDGTPEYELGWIGATSGLIEADFQDVPFTIQGGWDGTSHQASMTVNGGPLIGPVAGSSPVAAAHRFLNGATDNAPLHISFLAVYPALPPVTPTPPPPNAPPPIGTGPYPVAPPIGGGGSAGGGGTGFGQNQPGAPVLPLPVILPCVPCCTTACACHGGH